MSYITNKYKARGAALAGRGRSRSRNRGGLPRAKFETTEGDFEAELFLDRVPRTVSNFIDLARKGFYDGIHFHRVIKNFMNQFGCPHAKDPNARNAGTGGPPDGAFKNLGTGRTEQRTGGCILDENIDRTPNDRGTLSMANTGEPHTGGSQFFFNVNDNNFLDWFTPGDSKHPVFGRIVRGMDIVDKISRVNTRNDNPVVPIKMKKITIHNCN